MRVAVHFAVTVLLISKLHHFFSVSSVNISAIISFANDITNAQSYIDPHLLSERPCTLLVPISLMELPTHSVRDTD
ncbi:hypothetical protein F4824DRAFT_408404 [Ustulina deusta]|nr:hypothetical protein F4824DRAFT_408404 [Ustulina deusta]